MPGGRAVQAAEDVHHRALARARRPDDGDELPGVDLQADVREGRHVHVAHLVGPADALEVDDRLAHRSAAVPAGAVAAELPPEVAPARDAPRRHRSRRSWSCSRSAGCSSPVTTAWPSVRPLVISAVVLVTSPTPTPAPAAARRLRGAGRCSSRPCLGALRPARSGRSVALWIVIVTSALMPDRPSPGPLVSAIVTAKLDDARGAVAARDRGDRRTPCRSRPRRSRRARPRPSARP